MKWGILGTGNIASVFARTLCQVEGAECYAVASRTLEKAEQFAAEYGFAKAFGSYEELAADPEVEIIYIATPHSHHYENMKLCLTHRKPVLCEKAFTMNAVQAEEIRMLSEKLGVFAAEALWPRYMPSRALIQQTLDSGVIGKVTALTANLSYVISQNKRIMEPELAGGALLDVGVYGLNFAIMHFGNQISRIESSVQFAETGVDAMESITLFFEDGRMAVITDGIYARSDRKGIFYGDQGYMIVENINNPQSISVFDLSDRLVKHIEVPRQISGYEYEIRECMEAVKNKESGSSSMPLSESVYLMKVMDELRRQWGLVYPQEKK